VSRRVAGPFDDVLGLRDEPIPPEREPLLVPVMHGGRRIDGSPDLRSAREQFRSDLDRLPEAARRVEDPRPLKTRRSARLIELIEWTERTIID
jgi:nicotinate phosphoribosyltransferase